jgi:hypothetical protein
MDFNLEFMSHCCKLEKIEVASSVIQCYIVLWKSIDVSEENVAYIFRTKEQIKK